MSCDVNVCVKKPQGPDHPGDRPGRPGTKFLSDAVQLLFAVNLLEVRQRNAVLLQVDLENLEMHCYGWNDWEPGKTSP